MTDPGWSLLGGNPAPGSVEAVNAAAAGFSKVATHVDKIIDGLVTSGGKHSIQDWKGQAAEEFRSALYSVPDHLRLLSTSYAQASGALRRYGSALSAQQHIAATVRGAAVSAHSVMDREQRSAEEAGRRVAELHRQLVAAEAAQGRARLALATTTDPSSQSVAQSALTRAAAQTARVRSDLHGAEAEQGRHTRNVTAAREELERQRRRADGVREELHAAADQAIRALTSAERSAHLPSWLDRKLTESKEATAEYGPVFADSLRLGANLFSIAATVFPPGAYVFKPFALAMGAASFIVELASMGCSPDGISTNDFLKLGSDTFGLAAAVLAPGLGAAGQLEVQAGANALAAIATARTAGNEVGLRDLATSTLLLVGGAVAGKAAQGLIAQANRNPNIASFITRQSGNLTREINVSYSGVTLGRSVPPSGQTAEGVRLFRSVLSSGHLDGGQFLPGNLAASPLGDVHGADHMMSQTALDEQVLSGGADLASGITDLISNLSQSAPQDDNPAELSLPPTSGSRMAGESQ